MDLTEQIINYEKAGAPIQEGVRLFALLTRPDHPFLKLAKLGDKNFNNILRQKIFDLSGYQPQEQSQNQAPPVDQKKKLRDSWPFLSNEDCPRELKILAADKITAYHNYCKAHQQLFNCFTSADQLSAVRDLVENYIENRAIIKEFEFYKEHGHTLKKHPIFKALKQSRALRKLSVLQLIKKKENLEHNIWRIQSEINKNDKPHLLIDRKNSIKEKTQLIREIEQLLKDYQ